MWRMITFLLEGLIFLLVGLYLPLALEDLGDHGFGQLLLYAVLVSGAAIAVRLLWVFPSSATASWLRRKLDRPIPPQPWQNILFTGWAGIRGGDSLVIALSLPLATASGVPFPGRTMIIFLTFVVIVVTLVIIGLSLAPLARVLGLRSDEEEQQEVRAESKARAELDAAGSVAERRRALLKMWEQGAIEDGVMRQLQNELDLAEVLDDAESPRPGDR